VAWIDSAPPTKTIEELEFFSTGAMIIMEYTVNKILRKVLFWSPRLVGIVFVLFISIFALDVFDSGLGFWGTILGLFIHLIPSIVLGIAVALAWRRELVGTAAFVGWAVFYLASMRGFDWTVYAIIAGVPFGVGVLFLAGWIWRDQVRA
jgi:hypothetical protein